MTLIAPRRRGRAGPVALFHIAGVTPEAPSVEAAFHGHQPARRVPVTLDSLLQARRELTTAAGDALDQVVLGSPHLSLAEFVQLARLLRGARANAAGRVLAVPFTRGRSTTTAVLLEGVRAGTVPAAILTTAPDSFFALASIVAEDMYGRTLPVVALSAADYSQLRTGQLFGSAEESYTILRASSGSPYNRTPRSPGAAAGCLRRPGRRPASDLIKLARRAAQCVPPNGV